MTMTPIYLDHNATTPVDPDVLQAMLPYLRGQFGNPSSAYALGRYARDAVESARADVASLIGAGADEIVFTSGGTESSNIAIAGTSRRAPEKRAVVTTAIEHPATESVCALLARRGHDVRRIAPDANGQVPAAAMIDAIDDATGLVTMIHAQNETGVLQPVEEVAHASRRKNVLVHIDAAQSAGKIALDVRRIGVDFVTIAGHKLYAPKGVGALYVRRGVRFDPVLVGAGQEQGRRPGTENVAGIVALGRACAIAAERLQRDLERLTMLRDRLLHALVREIPNLKHVGHSVERLPNTLNVLFPQVSGRKLLENCPRVFASTGSACHADREDPSTILLAMGISSDEALGAVRLSVGRYTSEQDVDDAAAALASAWRLMTGAKPATTAA
ncbi:MAG: cysteine desulfurase family protein [Pseudorhodoplanes sp.]|jgi:cysteine desulfurase|nr:cysteine desulfurase family protein [Pseudorhodoplanes sp.]